MRPAECEHRRKKIIPSQRRGRPAVEWCRDCGAVRFGFLSDNPRWVLPGVRANAKRPQAHVVKRGAAAPQLWLVGVDDEPCPDCDRGSVMGVVCGFCDGTGMVPKDLGAALRFAKGSTTDDERK